MDDQRGSRDPHDQLIALTIPDEDYGRPGARDAERRAGRGRAVSPTDPPDAATRRALEPPDPTRRTRRRDWRTGTGLAGADRRGARHRRRLRPRRAGVGERGGRRRSRGRGGARRWNGRRGGGRRDGHARRRDDDRRRRGDHDHGRWRRRGGRERARPSTRAPPSGAGRRVSRQRYWMRRDRRARVPSERSPRPSSVLVTRNGDDDNTSPSTTVLHTSSTDDRGRRHHDHPAERHHHDQRERADVHDRRRCRCRSTTTALDRRPPSATVRHRGCATPCRRARSRPNPPSGVEEPGGKPADTESENTATPSTEEQGPTFTPRPGPPRPLRKRRCRSRPPRSRPRTRPRIELAGVERAGQQRAGSQRSRELDARLDRADRSDGAALPALPARDV